MASFLANGDLSGLIIIPEASRSSEQQHFPYMQPHLASSLLLGNTGIKRSKN
jgi:hypothetical protein